MFILRLNEKDYRRKYNSKSLYALAALKQTCILVYGVNLGNSLDNDLKRSNIIQFKRMKTWDIIKILNNIYVTMTVIDCIRVYIADFFVICKKGKVNVDHLYL